MTENLLVSLNDIEEKEASWLVPQRMPKGQIIILAGDGGSGKTSCWCSLAAAISTGAQVFFDETPKEFFESEPQKVLFFSSEDSLEYTLKARLAKWKELGYKVKHGASALFGCSLIWGSRGDGATYKASFFGKSQVEAI